MENTEILYSINLPSNININEKLRLSLIKVNSKIKFELFSKYDCGGGDFSAFSISQVIDSPKESLKELGLKIIELSEKL